VLAGEKIMVGWCMAFGTLVVSLLFGRMQIPVSFMDRVFENGCFGMHGVLILLKDNRVALLAGSVLQ
jgi:hypothetical protein